MMTARHAAKAITNGHIVAYPTESFYALGVDATNPKAIQKLFRIKKREPKKPIALIAADMTQVKKYFFLSREEERLAREYWPGALTILLRPKKTIAAKALGAKKIGVRVPAHAGARRLAHGAGAPLTATSANLSGQPPTKSVQKVTTLFPDILVMSGRCGRARQPSTVVDVQRSVVTILRPGAIKIS